MTLITQGDDERLKDGLGTYWAITRDSLRAALTRAEAAEAEVARLREAAKKWDFHQPWCAFCHDDFAEKCDCGLDDCRSALRKEQGK